jgi:hypothetical protein
MKTTLIIAGIIVAAAVAVVFYIRSKKTKSSPKIQPQTNTTKPDTTKE